MLLQIFKKGSNGINSGNYIVFQPGGHCIYDAANLVYAHYPQKSSSCKNDGIFGLMLDNGF